MNCTVATIALAALASGAAAQGIGIAEIVAEGHLTSPLRYGSGPVKRAPNGDLVFIGTTDDGAANEVFVVRTDPMGNVIWSRTFPRPGGPGEVSAKDLAVGADGKIYVVCSIEGSTSVRDFYYLCLNGFGFKLHERVVDHFDNDNQVGDIKVAPDGSVYFSGGGLDSSRPLLVKMNADLTTQWSYTLGSAAATGTQKAGGLDIADDGSVVCSATLHDGAQTDVQFVRLNDAGALVYEKVLGHATLNDAQPKVLLGTDGFTYFTYTRAQYTTNQEARLSQYSDTGVFQWNKSEPGFTETAFAQGPADTVVFGMVQDGTPWSTKVFHVDSAGTILNSRTLTRPNLDSNFLEQIEVDESGNATLLSFVSVSGKVGGDFLVTGLGRLLEPLYEWTYDTGDGNYDVPTGLVALEDGEVVVTGSTSSPLFDTHTFRLRPVLPVPPASVTIRLGRRDGGNLASLLEDDGDTYRMCKFIVPNQVAPPVNIELDATVPAGYPIRLVEFFTIVRANTPSLQQDTQLWNWLSNDWQPSVFTTLTTSEVKTVVQGLPDPTVEAGTRNVKARIRVRKVGPVTAAVWCVDIDQAGWRILP